MAFRSFIPHTPTCAGQPEWSSCRVGAPLEESLAGRPLSLLCGGGSSSPQEWPRPPQAGRSPPPEFALALTAQEEETSSSHCLQTTLLGKKREPPPPPAGGWAGMLGGPECCGAQEGLQAPQEQRLPKGPTRFLSGPPPLPLWPLSRAPLGSGQGSPPCPASRL